LTTREERQRARERNKRVRGASNEPPTKIRGVGSSRSIVCPRCGTPFMLQVPRNVGIQAAPGAMAVCSGCGTSYQIPSIPKLE
jgi:uncharacterized Zn-finger protein